MNLILSSKEWNRDLLARLKAALGGKWELISTKKEFNLENLNKLKPERVFIPHWSHIIPEEIFVSYECIVFHMTDLPYGRGGSPLQNLIANGHDSTKISAIRVDKGIDTGNVYLKKDLSLLGTAEEIFIRANDVIFDMIQEIIKMDIKALPQKGTPVTFKRRTPEMSQVSNENSINELYNLIRMLDAEGYPHAFIENESFRFEFTRASLKADKTIIADVRISKK